MSSSFLHLSHELAVRSHSRVALERCTSISHQFSQWFFSLNSFQKNQSITFSIFNASRWDLADSVMSAVPPESTLRNLENRESSSIGVSLCVCDWIGGISVKASPLGYPPSMYQCGYTLWSLDVLKIHPCVIAMMGRSL